MFWNRPAQKQPEPEPESRQQVLYYAQTGIRGQIVRCHPRDLAFDGKGMRRIGKLLSHN